MSQDRPAATPPRRGLVGRMLGGRYRVTRLVSAGASALIADAEDTEIGRRITVKLVRPEFAESVEFRNRFRTTMRSVTGLAHPNIAAVFDWGEELIGKRTTVYAVVEHLGGGSLRDLFDRGRHLDPSQALLVGLEACRGLDFAHRRGLVHTEVTPSKLVFGDDRRLRIVDFGLAALLGEVPWTEPATLPTHVARYSSPEQALSQPLDGKADVYALTLVLVEAVSGRVPFAARSTVATLAARTGRLMPVSADLGPLASVLERAGRPDAADRSTAAELGRALVHIAEKLPRPDPIPIIVAAAFDDPHRMRRPEDPTGGLTRPAPLGPEAPDRSARPEGEAVEPDTDADTDAADADTDAATEADADAGAAIATDDEDAAADAGAAIAADAESHRAEGGGAAPDAGDAHAGSGPAAEDSGPHGGALPPPPDAGPTPSPTVAPNPAMPTSPTSPPPSPPRDGGLTARVYDGDADATKDELAALARRVPGESIFGADDAPRGTTLQAVRPVLHEQHEQHEPAGVPGDTRLERAVPTTEQRAADSWSSQLATRKERRRSGRRWLVVLATLVFLGALGALALVASLLFRGPTTHEVPQLAGLDVDAATSRVAGFDWELDVRRERSDEQPVAGSVIRTEPAAGATLAEEEPFLLVVSEGPQLRALPELRGLAIGAAETALAELGLLALTPTERFDEEAAPGEVLAWSVPADSTLVAGGDVLPETQVAIVVSAGPEPRTVPDVVGRTVDEASAALRELRLEVDLDPAVFDNEVPDGVVISATPAAGEVLGRGATVVLAPSKGPDLVAVPDLSGLTLPQAREALAAAGLQVGAVVGNSLGTFELATVDGDEVGAGEEILRDTAVDVVFF